MNPTARIATLLEGSADDVERVKRLLEAADVSHDELRRNLQAAIKAAKGMPIPGYYCWIRDVFDDRVVYEEETPTGTTLYQQGYTVDDAGAVTLGADATKVRATTNYVAVKEAAGPDDSLEALLERAFSTEQRVALAKKGQAMPMRNADGEIVDGAYPIPDVAALKDAIQAIGRAKDPAAAKAHIRKRAKALGALNLIPEGWSESADPAAGGEDLEEAELVGEVVPLVEKAVRKDGTFPIRIIAPGWGTSGYYSEEVLKRDVPKVFPAGTHMHFDHPTVSEAKERPERSVRTIAAVTTSKPVWQDAGPAGPGMYAEAKARDKHRADIEELAPHIGVSIVASGRRKTGVAEGKKGPVIEAIDSGASIDFVTQAGAGGQVISLFEAARGRAISEALEEGDDVSEQELKEARDAQAAAEQKAATAEAELARLREGAILREARDIAMTALAKVTDLPEITRERLVEAVSADPSAHVKDGKLDAEAFGAAIAEAVKAEAAYLAKITGSGRVSGLGAAGEGAAVEAAEKRLEAALGRGFGLSEAGAKAAAGGRSH